MESERNSSAVLYRSVNHVVGGYAVRNGRVLLTWHERLHRWVPPGGQIEIGAGEYPHEAVVRQYKQESGLIIEVVDSGIGNIGDEVARALPMPIAIRELAVAPGEFYLEMIFICRIVGGELQLNYREARAYHWFDESDLERFPVMSHVREYVLYALKTLA